MLFLKVLDDENIKHCKKDLRVVKYQDGSLTQPLNKTYQAKKNKQTQSIPEPTRKYLSDLLYNNHYIDSIYCPSRVSINFYNKYQKGDYYDVHIDAFKAIPKSNNIYFDYGFSINLNDNYEGGEFILHTDVGPISRKLESGEAVIFPVIYPHGVNTVTAGTRENIIGWVSSNISYEQAFILKNLYEVNAHLLTTNKEHFVKSTLVQTYLKKAWGK